MAAIGSALGMIGSMAWEILWALILGFALSSIIAALVKKSTITRLLGDARPRTLAVAALLGAASSSCSYAAAALARALFRKGADFVAANAFMIASTNLVIELGVILWLLMGWQFTVAEFVGGPVMIVLLALLLRVLVRPARVRAAREQADKGIAGAMEGHAAMDMSVEGDAPFWRKLLSPAGYTSVSNVFVMEWAAILRDLVIGLVISGVLAAWVPGSFWQSLFLAHDPTGSSIVGPLIGPLVAILSFVCSIGNVPLAVVLWTGGISFGGVVAFIFADLIILPILNIYRRYYGTTTALLLGAALYATATLAGYLVELLFTWLRWIPSRAAAHLPDSGVGWNYTTWLNIVFLLVAAALIYRFSRTGGLPMLRMMGGSPDNEHDHPQQMDHPEASGPRAHH
jgi:uncharacterized membrane protein YraQ (UPF0718 family)